VARASANLLKQNAETLQNACRFGLHMATSVMGQSTEQFGRTLGLSGDGVQQATERSARNAQIILYTGTAAPGRGLTRACGFEGEKEGLTASRCCTCGGSISSNQGVHIIALVTIRVRLAFGALEKRQNASASSCARSTYVGLAKR
jgi:hypothetical protein